MKMMSANVRHANVLIFMSKVGKCPVFQPKVKDNTNPWGAHQLQTTKIWVMPPFGCKRTCKSNGGGCKRTCKSPAL